MTASSVQKIDARLAGLQPGTLRYQVLVALKQFRASWVELGRLLNEMVYGGDYKDAGYDDFEVYCASELGLKKPTVQKLMVSYNYMKKYEGNRLAALEDGGGGDAIVPDYQTVELLERVRRADEVPEEDIEAAHRRAFDEGADDEAELRKELRGMLRPALAGGQAAPNRDEVTLLRAAREFRKKLAATDFVPEGLRERLEQALTELEALEPAAVR